MRQPFNFFALNLRLFAVKKLGIMQQEKVFGVYARQCIKYTLISLR